MQPGDRGKRARKELSIFSKYNEGIRLSETMRYSVTREKISNRIAEKAIAFGATGAVDGCGGAGGNTIAFARAGLPTAYVDINLQNLSDAQHNAEIYGVSDMIWFFAGDALQFDCQSSADLDPASTVFFSSPEWGGPNYRAFEVFDVNLCQPSVAELLKYANEQKYFKKVLYLPRTSDIKQLEAMGCTEINYMFLEGWCDALCAWF